MQAQAIRDTIEKTLQGKTYGIPMPAGFDPQASLLAAGIIDSFGLFSFIQELQSIFGIVVEDWEIHPGNFETIDSIVTFIKDKNPQDT